MPNLHDDSGMPDADVGHAASPAPRVEAARAILLDLLTLALERHRARADTEVDTACGETARASDLLGGR